MPDPALPEKFTVGRLPERGCCTRGETSPVRLQHPACLARCVTVMTGPGIAGRMPHHSGTRRIGFDVSHAGQQIAITRDRTILVPPLPERATLSKASLHVTDVASSGARDRATDRFTRQRRHQVMPVTGHQHTSVNPAPMFLTYVSCSHLGQAAWSSSEKNTACRQLPRGTICAGIPGK
jgi:hypothetical protein